VVIIRMEGGAGARPARRRRGCVSAWGVGLDYLRGGSLDLDGGWRRRTAGLDRPAVRACGGGGSALVLAMETARGGYGRFGRVAVPCRAPVGVGKARATRGVADPTRTLVAVRCGLGWVGWARLQRAAGGHDFL
jgi:hypothetical protein